MRRPSIGVPAGRQRERSENAPTSQESLKLHVLDPDGQVRELLLRGSSFSIGRCETCTLQLQDRKVSRWHAEVLWLDGVWAVLDCRSQNGTYLNGVRLREPRRVRSGDILTLGLTKVIFLDGLSILAAPAAPAAEPATSLLPGRSSHRQQEASLHPGAPYPSEKTDLVDCAR